MAAESIQSRRRMLDAIAVKIHVSLRFGKRVLVHCVQAQERSPLAIAWYLVHSGKAQTLAEAYAFVIEKHPIAKRRDAWVGLPVT